jgi:phosphatidylethanolamine/phosphatidyl-N-methylethanolamine N-methyltransferase
VKRGEKRSGTPSKQGGRSSSGELLEFFRAWLANPLTVGAIMPSSTALGAVITSEIDVQSAPIIELGPGTGVFTRAMLAKGVPERQLALLDSDPRFASLLRLQFPAARVVCMNAARLRHVELFEGGVGAVLSGLPLLSMPPRTVAAILEGAFRHIRSGGAFYQFTYGLRCPVNRAILERLGLKAERIGRVLANVPPAFVFRIRRHESHAHRRKVPTPRRRNVS